jgi:hypothetical protein
MMNMLGGKGKSYDSSRGSLSFAVSLPLIQLQKFIEVLTVSLESNPYFLVIRIYQEDLQETKQKYLENFFLLTRKESLLIKYLMNNNPNKEMLTSTERKQ